MNIRNITLGSDPEFLAIDENGTPKSAVGFIPGTKKEPFPLTENGEYSIQIDNVGVEGCVPPTRTKEEFVNSIITIKKLANAKLQETQPSWKIVSSSSSRFEKKELDSDTARQFGCEPSFCVYTQDVSPRPSPDEVGNLRSFGFHIHIGFECDGNPITSLERIIKGMDIFCGVGSILIDSDNDRRNIYGNAGDMRFRYLDNGITIVEYRTLGGAMSRDEEIIGWCYDRTMDAINAANNWTSELEDLAEKAKLIIDKGNDVAATEFIKNLNIQIPNEIFENKKQTSIA